MRLQRRLFFVAAVEHPSLNGGCTMLASGPDADLEEASQHSVRWEWAFTPLQFGPAPSQLSDP